MSISTVNTAVSGGVSSGVAGPTDGEGREGVGAGAVEECVVMKDMASIVCWNKVFDALEVCRKG